MNIKNTGKHGKASISWAKHISGRMVHISHVENGLACHCSCVDCEEPLVAKNGGKLDRLKHFAHKAYTECVGESALHAAAKQIVVDYADEGLTLPSLEGTSRFVDSLGASLEHNIATKQKHINGYTAETEVRKNNLVVDVLVNHGSEQWAVEIFYTHQKSETDKTKFSAQKLNAIEIDISELEPNTAPEKLKDAVLDSAPRIWLYSSEKENLISMSNANLKRKSDETMDDRVRKLMTLADEWVLRRHHRGFLPEIAHEVTIDGRREIYTPPLRVTNVNSAIENTDREAVWKRLVTINNKTKTEVFFLPSGQSTYGLSDKVHLVYTYESTLHDVELAHLGWRNLHLWQERLKKNAERTADSKRESLQNFVTSFQASPDYSKFSNIARKLNMEPGQIRSAQERHNYHWNCPNYVWQSLVLNYYLKTNDYVDCSHIAENDWLQNLLGFQKTSKSQEGRSKSVYFWFKNHLSTMGLVSHSYGLFWSVQNDSLKRGLGRCLSDYIG
ncbi:hypothetical protein [Vibrio sp. CB1-14]|uniref:Uncharacterized protein n=1 Tax=Vibrio chaetopteri TaxID=3016528 RepID=A0AAU8BN13_9VIBR